MRKSIVTKLFLLSMGLCLFVVASIFAGQTLFFKQFYVHKKVDNVQTALRIASQEDGVHTGNARSAFRNEQQFYEKYNTWIAALDSEGNLKYSDDFEAEVRLENAADAPVLSGKSIAIPLYMVMNVEDLSDGNRLRLDTFVKPGERIAIEGILIGSQLYPQRIGRNASNLREENRLENGQLVRKEYEVVPRFKSPTEYHKRYPSVLVYGTLTQVRTPEGASESRYMNHLFLERVKAFQADLLYGDLSGKTYTVSDYEENNVPYKIFVKQLMGPAGNAEYLFAMTSLQPVNEAAGVMRHYYGYIVLGTLLLVLLASFYYSRRIARPLLRMNDATQRMASLDFSVRIPVVTEDEIGSLSRNINRLSSLLHDHIVRLEQDIEQEKRLEQTRKEFIAGVSHELKTPLSVIESCLYIIKDKPESQKREYYFAAMEDEVKKMNLLIADMLELAKYESGTYKMEMDSFRIDAVLERVCTKLAPDITGNRLRLHTHFVPVEVFANPLRIEQVIVNFLTNAIRYTPEGENIFVEAVEERETVKVCIENKGAHIPDDQMEKIWDRFYRGDRSRHRSTGGIGLGLAICKQILELHGVPYGAVNTGDGVRFFFELNKKKA
ncbi:Adaptive-response sensory-kinase SasA [Paenibacillus solanacearum]|uniref:histidine kinase n=1 Tax=Paenibacillus solanacearum TaxID=2048548 RepID=A0A916K335_9BACL|nr:HAMP domain-containing sensor histidine kinase [Paenibacillus solanacearum]CAG7627848.1 Adaptive-response sensory-kinase SasA [Paenibacillus solanacearum]